MPALFNLKNVNSDRENLPNSNNVTTADVRGAASLQQTPTQLTDQGLYEAARQLLNQPETCFAGVRVEGTRTRRAPSSAPALSGPDTDSRAHTKSRGGTDSCGTPLRATT
jgi:hypothetical protein